MKRLIMYVMIGIMILQACASLPDDQGNQFKVKSGTTVLDIENKFGESSCHFSYFMDGKKYDFVEFAQSPSLAVFEDNRLYTVILRGQRSNLDKLFIESMGKDDLPLEKGLCPIHSWVREYRDMTGIRLDLEEGDDLVVILAGDQQHLEVLVMVVDVFQHGRIAHVVDDQHHQVDGVVVQDPDRLLGVPGIVAFILLAAQEVIDLRLDLRFVMDEKQVHSCVLFHSLFLKAGG